MSSAAFFSLIMMLTLTEGNWFRCLVCISANICKCFSFHNRNTIILNVVFLPVFFFFNCKLPSHFEGHTGRVAWHVLSCRCNLHLRFQSWLIKHVTQHHQFDLLGYKEAYVETLKVQILDAKYLCLLLKTMYKQAQRETSLDLTPTSLPFCNSPLH